MQEKSLGRRILLFFLVLSSLLGVVYGIFPVITRNVPVLQQMSEALEENGIDPTRYYYTDVEPVANSEEYLQRRLDAAASQ